MKKAKWHLMIFRLLVKWSKSSLVTFFSILFKLAGLVATVYYIYKRTSTPESTTLINYVVSNKESFLGYFLVVFIAILTLVKDIASLLDNGMSRLPFDSGQPGSDYDIVNFFDETTEKVIIVGLNLCPMLQKPGVVPHLLQMLSKYKSNILIVLATPEQNASLGDRQRIDFKESVKLLNNLESEYWRICAEKDRDLLKIRFHPDASSMSALFKDPHKKDNAEIVTTVKWATDREHDNRLYFVTSKWEHPEFFKKLHGPEQDWLRNSEELRDISSRVGEKYHSDTV